MSYLAENKSNLSGFADEFVPGKKSHKLLRTTPFTAPYSLFSVFPPNRFVAPVRNVSTPHSLFSVFPPRSFVAPVRNVSTPHPFVEPVHNVDTPNSLFSVFPPHPFVEPVHNVATPNSLFSVFPPHPFSRELPVITPPTSPLLPIPLLVKSKAETSKCSIDSDEKNECSFGASEDYDQFPLTELVPSSEEDNSNQNHSIISRLPSEILKNIITLVGKKTYLPLTITHKYIDYQIYTADASYRVVENIIGYNHVGNVSYRSKLAEFYIDDLAALWDLLLYHITNVVCNTNEDDILQNITRFSYIKPNGYGVKNNIILVNQKWDLSNPAMLQQCDVSEAKYTFTTMVSILGKVFVKEEEKEE
jgi:hypothetical protein